MRSNTSPSPQDHSHFVRLLTELSGKKLHLPEYNLAERMGHFFDLSSSLTLSRELQKNHLASEVAFDNAEPLQQIVLTCRAKMISNINQGFIDGPGETLLKVPSTVVGIHTEVLQTYTPYQRFYSKHQLAMAVEINELRNTVRSGVAGFSSQLSQLADLDKTLEQSMAAHSQKLFALTPKLLNPQFKIRQEEYLTNTKDKNTNELDHWLMPDGWLTLFYQDMKKLLLAELDLRLQPIFGLLEALDEHTKTII